MRINTITLGIVGQVCKTAPAEQRQENHKAVREGSRFGGPVLPMYVHRERGGAEAHMCTHMPSLGTEKVNNPSQNENK